MEFMAFSYTFILENIIFSKKRKFVACIIIVTSLLFFSDL